MSIKKQPMCLSFRIFILFSLLFVNTSFGKKSDVDKIREKLFEISFNNIFNSSIIRSFLVESIEVLISYLSLEISTSA